ncbi:iron-containing redox enzyme family protein [Paraburkholderia youngii]|uniref:iron-containing redox enzyme family protein n=1 Tax=Paraburkholderia youngii TaxID=2782701 RepID=UPI003D260669
MDLRNLQDQAVSQLTATRMVHDVLASRFCKAQYIRYMLDVYCYALHSSQVIATAGARLALSNPPLADYLFSHAREELGHDRWAHSDLVDLGLQPDAISSVEPSAACLRMIGLEYLYAAHLNPVGLFGWLYVLESLGGKIGGQLAAIVDETLRLEGKALYFLKGHADADAHHSEDLFRIISDHVNSEDDRHAFCRVYRESLDLYCQVLDSAWTAAAQD